MAARQSMGRGGADPRTVRTWANHWEGVECCACAMGGDGRKPPMVGRHVGRPTVSGPFALFVCGSALGSEGAAIEPCPVSGARHICCSCKRDAFSCQRTMHTCVLSPCMSQWQCTVETKSPYWCDRNPTYDTTCRCGSGVLQLKRYTHDVFFHSAHSGIRRAAVVTREEAFGTREAAFVTRDTSGIASYNCMRCRYTIKKRAMIQ